MPELRLYWNHIAVRCCLAFTLLFAASAQESGTPAAEPAPKGIVRGKLLQSTANTVWIRSVTGDTWRCGFDKATYFERDGQRVFAGALRAADPLELVTDTRAGDCYARTVRIVPLPTRAVATRPYRSALDHIFPRGNLTFAGVVRRLNPEMLVLRTRTEPEQIVLLRDDTRYLASGLPSDFSNLLVNTRVFIRGGKNFQDELEAYQVIWGEIAGPRVGP